MVQIYQIRTQQNQSKHPLTPTFSATNTSKHILVACCWLAISWISWFLQVQHYINIRFRNSTFLVCFFHGFSPAPSFRDPQVGKVHQARRIRQRLSAPEAAAVVRREHHQAGTVFQGVAGEVFDDLREGSRSQKTMGNMGNFDELWPPDPEFLGKHGGFGWT